MQCTRSCETPKVSPAGTDVGLGLEILADDARVLGGDSQERQCWTLWGATPLFPKSRLEPFAQCDGVRQEPRMVNTGVSHLLARCVHHRTIGGNLPNPGRAWLWSESA